MHLKVGCFLLVFEDRDRFVFLLILLSSNELEELFVIDELSTIINDVEGFISFVVVDELLGFDVHHNDRAGEEVNDIVLFVLNFLTVLLEEEELALV